MMKRMSMYLKEGSKKSQNASFSRMLSRGIEVRVGIL